MTSCTDLETNVGKSNFSEQSKKLIHVINELAITWILCGTARLVINPIIVDGYASHFNVTTVIRASDSMTASL